MAQHREQGTIEKRRPGDAAPAAKGRGGVVFAVVVALMLCVGGGLLAYPTVSDAFARHERATVIREHDSVVIGIPGEELAEEVQRAQDYNERLFAGGASVADPFGTAGTAGGDAEYFDLLNPAGDGVMGTLTIPALEMTLPVAHGTSEEVLAHGAGHLRGSSLPVGGESSHTVLAGHTALIGTRIFDDINQLAEGDLFVLDMMGHQLVYEVCDIRMVLPDETESLAVQPGRDLATLVTCAPYGLNTHRLLVSGERLEAAEEGGAAVEKDVLTRRYGVEQAIPLPPDAVPVGVAGVAAVALVAGIALVLRGRRS